VSVSCAVFTRRNWLEVDACRTPLKWSERGAREACALAQRSSSAASEINSLIGDSTEKVEHGTKLVSQIGETMHEIVDHIRELVAAHSIRAGEKRLQTIGFVCCLVCI